MKRMFRMDAHLITGTNQCARTSLMLVSELFADRKGSRKHFAYCWTIGICAFAVRTCEPAWPFAGFVMPHAFAKA